MHSILTIWRLRPGEDFDRLIDEVSARLAEGGSALPGHLAGYAMQLSPDTMATFNVYASAEEATVASHALSLLVWQVMEGHAQVVERHSGPARTLKEAGPG